MTATVAGIHLGIDTHANRPAGNAVPDGAFYSCSTHGLIYKSNYAGNSWATWATLGGAGVATDAIWDAAGDLAVGTGADTAAKLTKGSDLDVLTISASTHVPVWAAPSGGGIADQGAFTYLDATEAAAPGTPASGYARIYAKTDGRIYSKDDGGIEYGPFDTGGGGVDLADFRLVDCHDTPGELALGTYGDEFEYASQAAFAAVWTAVGSPNLWAEGSGVELTCSPAEGIYIPATIATNSEIGMLVRLVKNTLAASMITVGYVDNSGNGYGALIREGNATGWGWGISAYGLGSGETGDTAIGTGAVYWIRLKRTGNDFVGKVSADGGATWTQIFTKTTTITPTRLFIGNLYSSRVQWRVHRFVYGEPNLGLD